MAIKKVSEIKCGDTINLWPGLIDNQEVVEVIPLCGRVSQQEAVAIVVKGKTRKDTLNWPLSTEIYVVE